VAVAFPAPPQDLLLDLQLHLGLLPCRDVDAHFQYQGAAIHIGKGVAVDLVGSSLFGGPFPLLGTAGFKYF